jgi:hypothetical protein
MWPSSIPSWYDVQYVATCDLAAGGDMGELIMDAPVQAQALMSLVLDTAVGIDSTVQQLGEVVADGTQASRTTLRDLAVGDHGDQMLLLARQPWSDEGFKPLASLVSYLRDPRRSVRTVLALPTYILGEPEPMPLMCYLFRPRTKPATLPPTDPTPRSALLERSAALADNASAMPPLADHVSATPGSVRRLSAKFDAAGATKTSGDPKPELTETFGDAVVVVPEAANDRTASEAAPAATAAADTAFASFISVSDASSPEDSAQVGMRELLEQAKKQELLEKVEVLKARLGYGQRRAQLEEEEDPSESAVRVGPRAAAAVQQERVGEVAVQERSGAVAMQQERSNAVTATEPSEAVTATRTAGDDELERPQRPSDGARYSEFELGEFGLLVDTMPLANDGAAAARRRETQKASKPAAVPAGMACIRASTADEMTDVMHFSAEALQPFMVALNVMKSP